jgi:hypothetical protein
MRTLEVYIERGPFVERSSINFRAIAFDASAVDEGHGLRPVHRTGQSGYPNATGIPRKRKRSPSESNGILWNQSVWKFIHGRRDEILTLFDNFFRPLAKSVLHSFQS